MSNKKRSVDPITAARRVVEKLPMAIGSPLYSAVMTVMLIQAINNVADAIKLQTRTMRSGGPVRRGIDKDTGTAIIGR